MFSKKHYEFIAKTLRVSSVPDGEIMQIACEFADRFAKDNPRFCRATFLEACISQEPNQE